MLPLQVSDVPTVKVVGPVGATVTVMLGRGQELSAGFVAEHEPSHWLVPALVMPHELAAEVQAFPYPAGFEGVLAEQELSHWIVPDEVCPHIFAPEVQALPYPVGSGGAACGHVPVLV
jgi:hypothetical protein